MAIYKLTTLSVNDTIEGNSEPTVTYFFDFDKARKEYESAKDDAFRVNRGYSWHQKSQYIGDCTVFNGYGLCGESFLFFKKPCAFVDLEESSIGDEHTERLHDIVNGVDDEYDTVEDYLADHPNMHGESSEFEYQYDPFCKVGNGDCHWTEKDENEQNLRNLKKEVEWCFAKKTEKFVEEELRTMACFLAHYDDIVVRASRYQMTEWVAFEDGGMYAIPECSKYVVEAVAEGFLGADVREDLFDSFADAKALYDRAVSAFKTGSHLSEERKAKYLRKVKLFDTIAVEQELLGDKVTVQLKLYFPKEWDAERILNAPTDKDCIFALSIHPYVTICEFDTAKENVKRFDEMLSLIGGLLTNGNENKLDEQEIKSLKNMRFQYFGHFSFDDIEALLQTNVPNVSEDDVEKVRMLADKENSIRIELGSLAFSDTLNRIQNVTARKNHPGQR